MEFKTTKKDLLRIVSKCQGAAAKTPTMPALGCVLLTAKNKTLTVSATDLYLSLTGSTSAEIKKSGSIAVHAKDVIERIKAMPDGAIVVSANDKQEVLIKSTESARKFTLHGLPGSDFPGVHEPNGDALKEAHCPIGTISRSLALTHFSVSQDETRPHVNSLLFELGDCTARAVSTDGHRLSLSELVTPTTPSMSMLLPLKGVGELRKLVDGADSDSCAIAFDGKTAFFSVDGMRLGVRVADAQFPPYQQVIPKEQKRHARLSRSEFSDALNAMRVAASALTGGIKVNLVPGAVRVTCEGPDVGSGFDEVKSDFDGVPVEIGFCARYLLDVLAVITDDEVILSMGDELDPATIRGVGDSGQYTAVVMPMRV